MSTSQGKISVSAPAGSDLSTKQYYFVSINSSGQLALTGTGAYALGVLQDKPAAAGRAGEVGIAGQLQVIAGSAGFTAGDDIASDSLGKAVTASSTNIVLGVALETAVAGDIARIHFHPRNAK